MKVVQCARCGHENRAAISVSICDRCGADISTAPDLNAHGDERDLRINPAEVVVTEAVGPAPDKPPPPQTPETAPAPPRPSAGRRALSLLGRAMLATAALALGIAGGLLLRLGTAIGSDPQLAGSIAILAAAMAVGGLVMTLVGGSAERSQSVTWGLRTLGFLLAVLGVWAVTIIANVAIHSEEPDDSATQDLPPSMMPGPGMGPGTFGPPVSGPMPGPQPSGPPGPQSMGGPGMTPPGTDAGPPAWLPPPVPAGSGAPTAEGETGRPPTKG